MRRSLVTAEGRDDQQSRCADAPPQVAEQIESGIISPVQILDQQQAGIARRGEQAQQRLEGGQLAVPRDREPATAVALDIAQRPKWLRRAEVFAAADVDLRIGAMRAHKVERRGGLADARLAFERHDAPVAGARALQRRLEPGSGLFTLQQHVCYPVGLGSLTRFAARRNGVGRGRVAIVPEMRRDLRHPAGPTHRQCDQAFQCMRD